MTTNNAAIIELDGKKHMKDARGALVPLETVKPMDQLQDETVRKIITYARALSQQIARFKGHTFEDIGSLLALMEQHYGAKPGGKKGNMTFTSFDGCMKVQVAVADHIIFGAELQIAKALIDECLKEWGAESRAELRAIITRAFQVDKEGRVNRAELFMLMRTEIEDARWKQAMEAIRESMRVIGSKQYIRFYERPSPTAPWQIISVDIANAPEPLPVEKPLADDGTVDDAAPVMASILQQLSGLSYDGRADFLAALVAVHAQQGTDAECNPEQEVAAIASQAQEIVLACAADAVLAAPGQGQGGDNASA